MYIKWKKIIIGSLDVLLAVYLVLAVTSWNKPNERETVCNEVNINISDTNNAGFLSATEVKDILTKAKLYPLNKAMQVLAHVVLKRHSKQDLLLRLRSVIRLQQDRLSLILPNVCLSFASRAIQATIIIWMTMEVFSLIQNIQATSSSPREISINTLHSTI